MDSAGVRSRRGAAVGACSTADDAEPPKIDDIAAEVGCANPSLVDTEEPSVQQQYACESGDRLLIFDNATTREDYPQVGVDDASTWVSGEDWAYQAA